MTLVDNPTLTQALVKLPYPLADYRAFAAAWPHTAGEIQGLHQSLMPFLPKSYSHGGNKPFPTTPDVSS